MRKKQQGACYSAALSDMRTAVPPHFATELPPGKPVVNFVVFVLHFVEIACKVDRSCLRIRAFESNIVFWGG